MIRISWLRSILGLFLVLLMFSSCTPTTKVYVAVQKEEYCILGFSLYEKPRVSGLAVVRKETTTDSMVEEVSPYFHPGDSLVLVSRIQDNQVFLISLRYEVDSLNPEEFDTIKRRIWESMHDKLKGKLSITNTAIPGCRYHVFSENHCQLSIFTKEDFKNGDGGAFSIEFYDSWIIDELD